MVRPVRISILVCRPSSWTSANTRSPMRGGAYIEVTLAISFRGIALVVKPNFMFGLSIICMLPFLPRDPAASACATGLLLECGLIPKIAASPIRCHHELRTYSLWCVRLARRLVWLPLLLPLAPSLLWLERFNVLRIE